MNLVRGLSAVIFYLCMYWTLADNNYKGTSVDRRTANNTDMTTTMSGETKQLNTGETKQPNERHYYCDEENKSGHLNRRARRESMTLVDMQKSNARKLDDMQKTNAKLLEDIVNGVNKFAKGLDTVIDVQKTNAKILEDIANGANKLNSSSISPPFFISMFLMLADIYQSTSSRTAKNQADFVRIMDYIIPNLDEKEDSVFLRNGLSHIVGYVGIFSSCLDLLNAGHMKSGVYTVRIPNTKKSVSVYCDQDTDGGGWLVFQRRNDGSVDFYRSWEEYGRGYGNVAAEFWLGNDILHELTQTNQELRVDLTDFAGNTAYAKYSSFSVGSPSDYFRLSISGYSGTAGDSMRWHNGHRFYTKDNDNVHKCAVTCHGAWWYFGCGYSNLNGLYKDREITGYDGITWAHWKNAYKSLKGSEMKIRPKI